MRAASLERACLHILIVEDDPGDIRLFREAISRHPTRTRIETLENGEVALAHLEQAAAEGAMQLPDLILLDLNLPRIGGKELLAHLKRNARLRQVPVVILTTSRSDEDVRQCYEWHANCYITKPDNWRDLNAMIGQILTFWGRVVRLPEAC